MTPTMLFTPEGRIFAAYGSPGGASIINSVINMTMNLIDHKMGLQEAIDVGRISVTSALATMPCSLRLACQPPPLPAWPRSATRSAAATSGPSRRC